MWFKFEKLYFKWHNIILSKTFSEKKKLIYSYFFYHNTFGIVHKKASQIFSAIIAY